jgi:hypothetical protein
VTGAILAILVGTLIYFAVVQYNTLSNTNSTVMDVANAQTNHAETLDKIERLSVQENSNAAQIKHLVQEIATFQLEQAQGNTTVGQILREAGAEVAALQASQAKIELSVAQLCSSAHITCAVGG